MYNPNAAVPLLHEIMRLTDTQIEILQHEDPDADHLHETLQERESYIEELRQTRFHSLSQPDPQEGQILALLAQIRHKENEAQTLTREALQQTAFRLRETRAARTAVDQYEGAVLSCEVGATYFDQNQ